MASNLSWAHIDMLQNSFKKKKKEREGKLLEYAAENVGDSFT